MFKNRPAVLAALSVLLCSTSVYGAPVAFTGFLSGANENPANGSAGTGNATITYDASTHLLNVNVSFSGLTGNTTASHIHCCVVPNGNIGVATTTPTFTGFPLGVTSGTYTNTLDMTQVSSYNPSFITANGGTVAGAEAALANGLNSGMAYLNIHTTSYPGGEIRSFLVLGGGSPSAVPALSGTALALLAGLLAIGGAIGLRRLAA